MFLTSQSKKQLHSFQMWSFYHKNRAGVAILLMVRAIFLQNSGNSEVAVIKWSAKENTV